MQDYESHDLRFVYFLSFCTRFFFMLYTKGQSLNYRLKLKKNFNTKWWPSYWPIFLPLTYIYNTWYNALKIYINLSFFPKIFFKKKEKTREKKQNKKKTTLLYYVKSVTVLCYINITMFISLLRLLFIYILFLFLSFIFFFFSFIIYLHSRAILLSSSSFIYKSFLYD